MRSHGPWSAAPLDVEIRISRSMTPSWRAAGGYRHSAPLGRVDPEPSGRARVRPRARAPSTSGSAGGGAGMSAAQLSGCTSTSSGCACSEAGSASKLWPRTPPTERRRTSTSSTPCSARKWPPRRPSTSPCEPTWLASPSSRASRASTSAISPRWTRSSSSPSRAVTLSNMARIWSC